MLVALDSPPKLGRYMPYLNPSYWSYKASYLGGAHLVDMRDLGAFLGR